MVFKDRTKESYVGDLEDTFTALRKKLTSDSISREVCFRYLLLSNRRMYISKLSAKIFITTKND